MHSSTARAISSALPPPDWKNSFTGTAFPSGQLYMQGEGKDDKVAVQLLEESAYFVSLHIKGVHYRSARGTAVPGTPHPQNPLIIRVNF